MTKDNKKDLDDEDTKFLQMTLQECLNEPSPTRVPFGGIQQSAKMLSCSHILASKNHRRGMESIASGMKEHRRGMESIAAAVESSSKNLAVDVASSSTIITVGVVASAFILRSKP